MAEELTRRSRLATALIAGPAVTVGLLGVGAAPVLADEEGEPTVNIEPNEVEPGGTIDVVGENFESDEDVVFAVAEETLGTATATEDGDIAAELNIPDDAEVGSAELAATFDGETVATSDFTVLQGDEDESGDEDDDAAEVDNSVDGSVVEFTGFPEGASVTAEHGEDSVGAGAPEDGNLTFDAAEYISTLGLEPGENTLTFSWSWFEDNEQQEDSVEVTVEIEAPDEGEVTFEVDGPVITGTGFPEGVSNVSIEAPSGGSTSAALEEDGTLSFDAAEAADILELDFGEQTLSLSWSWNDPDHGQQEDSDEVTVAAIPPLETGEDLTTEEIIAGLIGDDTDIDNVQSIGEGFQVGQFSGWDALGLPAGIVLSTGNLLESWQALTGSGSGGFSDNLDGDGDSDLDAILEGAADEGSNPETQDAAGLEFSFVPQEANVRFSYVFASDEYTYLDGIDDPGGSVNFNDIFAFFVNGQNYALFETGDGETLPVSIENINSVANSELYNDNLADDDGDRPNSGTNIGGYTNVLTFTAPVTPGELNTIKLAVADVNDGAYDSFVVLQSGSFEQVEGPVVQGGEFTTAPGEAVGSEFDLNTNTDDPEWSIDVTDGIDEEAGELDIDGTSWEFTPADDFTGEVSFTFTANDGSLNSAPATITITVEDEEEDDDDDDNGDEDELPNLSDELEVDPNNVPEGSNPHSTTQETPIVNADGDVVGYVDEGTILAIVATDADWPAAPIAGEDLWVPDYNEYLQLLDDEDSTPPEDDDDATPPEDDGDDDATPPEDDDEDESDDEGSKDDQEPAGDVSEDEDGEELAETGMSNTALGMLAGLLLLVGGALAVFGYRGRFSRKA